MPSITRKLSLTVLLIFICFISFSCGKKLDTTNNTQTPIVPVTTTKYNIAFWLTNPNSSTYFQKQGVGLNFTSATNNYQTINIDTTTTYQTIDGFGFTLTGGSATLLHNLNPTLQDALLKELFSTDSTHIGISYLRISLGASDLSSDDFTYDDLVQGTDVNLFNFNIEKEKSDLIPILQKIIAINPTIKILACPWTAPVWMKLNTIGNNGFTGGSLNPIYYDAYARYFVKYIQAMKAQGITIDAITPQNEPLNPNNNPAMVMQPAEEGNFVKNNLGPQFKAAGIATKIILYDHNTDRTDYPLTILADPLASPYVDGSAFHLYAGNIDALTPVHNAYPDKNIYFTEQYTASTGTFTGDFGWHVSNLIIGATRNWSRNVLEWNLANDPTYGPHTNGGCTTCKGALTLTPTTVSRNVSYYIIAHASKFIRPGAVRIASNNLTSMPNVAFKNPDGSKVLVVINNGSSEQTFNIAVNGKVATSSLPSGAAATYVW